jgi:hypothetical protein
MVTHIDTLSVRTPKGRRRIRRILGMSNDHPLMPADATSARDIARIRERKAALIDEEKQ